MKSLSTLRFYIWSSAIPSSYLRKSSMATLHAAVSLSLGGTLWISCSASNCWNLRLEIGLKPTVLFPLLTIATILACFAAAGFVWLSFPLLGCSFVSLLCLVFAQLAAHCPGLAGWRSDGLLDLSLSLSDCSASLSLPCLPVCSPPCLSAPLFFCL